MFIFVSNGGDGAIGRSSELWGCVLRTGFLLLVYAAGSLGAQQFGFGVKGGVPAADDFSGFSVASQESGRYIVGPEVDVRLPWHLGLEVDALYRRSGYTSAFGSCCGSGIIRERANSWEFPIIVKYHFGWRLAHPYAGAGYAPRIVHGADISSGNYLSGVSSNPPADIYTYYFNNHVDTTYPLTHGLVISGGIDLGGRHIRVSPEVRYVRWSAPYLDQTGGDGSYRIQSSQNELSLMVGITFR
jgi:hypothetical protein